MTKELTIEDVLKTRAGDELFRAIQVGHVQLVGPTPGPRQQGKVAALSLILLHLGKPGRRTSVTFLRDNLNAYLQRSGGSYGELAEAMRGGFSFIVTDIEHDPVFVMLLLEAVMGRSSGFFDPDTREQIVPHPDFRLILVGSHPVDLKGAIPTVQCPVFVED